MNQVAHILALATQVIEQRIDAVLAIVVRTEGSAYRQPGAMMLICADGRSVGMISGGCLEPHIIKRAFWLTRNGANVQVYQTGEDSSGEDNNNFEDENSYLDGELNFGLGCNGRVHVLFERLATATPLLNLIRQVRTTQQPAAITTLIRADDSKDIEEGLQVGSRIALDKYLETSKLADILLDQNMSVDRSNFVNDRLLNIVKKLSTYKLYEKNTKYIKVGQTEWLLQRIEPQIRLLICGAGNDVMPLVTMAKLQDWHVTVIDSRPQYATRMRFPQADIVKYVSLEDTDTLRKLSIGAGVAVMSHSLTQDRARLAVLLEHSAQCRYLGQLGPRYRTERLIKEISEASADPHVLSDGISKLHYPIGYKLGGDGPEALALSIMAQISTVIHAEATPDIFSVSKEQSDQSYLQASAQSPALLI